MSTGSNEAPVARTSMLIRQPPATVFEAFADPSITSKFWFSDGMGRLDRVGAEAVWNWKWYGVSARVKVLEIGAPHCLVYEWRGEGEAPTRVEYSFEERREGTFMTVQNSGFAGEERDQFGAAMDSLGGFSLVLAGAKAWLEHGVALGLIPDRFPDAHIG